MLLGATPYSLVERLELCLRFAVVKAAHGDPVVLTWPAGSAQHQDLHNCSQCCMHFLCNLVYTISLNCIWNVQFICRTGLRR